MWIRFLETALPSHILSFFGNIDPYRLHDHSGDDLSLKSQEDDSSGKKKSSIGRKPGWTEYFGTAAEHSSSPCHAADSSWEDEAKYARRILEKSPVLLTDNVVTLVQYRMAWAEQLLLRILKVPYTVINSPRFFTETTGPLPFIIHPSMNNVVLIGKYDKPPPLLTETETETEPSMLLQSQSAIVDYLLSTDFFRCKQGQDILASISNHQDQLYILWIQKYLDPILLLLRYGHQDMWQVDQQQSVRTYSQAFQKNIIFLTWRQMFGHFQATTERFVACKNLFLDIPTILPSKDWDPNNKKHLHNILQQTRVYYSSLNQILSDTLHTSTLSTFYASLMQRCRDNTADNDEDNSFLLTTTPSLLVILLFSHLAEALHNIHLITILASYPHLISFYQNIYSVYFESSTPWQKYNQRMNHSNIFHSIPCFGKHVTPTTTRALLFPWWRNKKLPESYTDAIQIMQRIAIHTHPDLNTVLDTVLYQQEQESLLRNRNDKVKLHLKEEEDDNHNNIDDNDDDVNKKHTPTFQENQLKRMKEEARKKDQLWISGVVVCTMLGYVLTALKSIKE